MEESQQNNKKTLLVDDIINAYGYKKKIISSIVCFCLTLFAQGIEMLFFADYLIPLKDYFNFSDTQIEMISGTMFISIGLGSFLCGFISNIFGRTGPIKLLLILTVIFHFSMMIVKNVIYFAIIRCFIGFFIGVIVPLQLSILTEYLPLQYRAFVLTSVYISNSLGMCTDALILYVIMPNLNPTQLAKCAYTLGALVLICIIPNLFLLNLYKYEVEIIVKDSNGYLYNKTYNIIKESVKRVLRESNEGLYEVSISYFLSFACLIAERNFSFLKNSPLLIALLIFVNS